MKTINKILIPLIVVGTTLFGCKNYISQEESSKHLENKRIESAKDAFKYFDINENKTIELNEFINKYPKINYKNHVPFNDYDLNKDGKIDIKEFTKVFPTDDAFIF